MAKDLNKLLNGYKSKSSKSILDCIQAGEPIQIDGISDIFEFISEGVDYLFDRAFENKFDMSKKRIDDIYTDGSGFGDDGCDCDSCSSDDD